MKREVAAQLNVKQKLEKDINVVDFDDLWIKAPESFNSTPGVYVRHENENEIDALWAGLKDNHHKPTSPVIYLTIGFFAGVLVTIIAATILLWGTGNKNVVYGDPTSTNTMPVEQQQQQITIPDENNQVAKKPTGEFKNIINYTIQSGDSLGSIAAKYYKSSSPENVQLIQQANNLKSPHSITAGDKLIIPVKE